MKNNKKIISKRCSRISIISCIFLILTMLNISTAVAWDNCPFGETNDTYPGNCGRYIDTDNDGICDLSQPSPENRVEQKERVESGNASIQIEFKGRGIDYFFIPIALFLVASYLTSLILSKTKKIKAVQHRKIWNLLLMITFLVSGILGILLVLKVSFGIEIPSYSNALFFHVEFGIAMTFISIFHIIWHWKYFRKMLTKKS